MVSEMVERVARALCRQAGYGIGEEDWPVYAEAARAAIAAMREPTEGMVDAAYAYDDIWAQLSESCEVIYTVMIDAALKETK